MDFILDLYWPACNSDWPSALHVTNKPVIGSTYKTVTAHSVLNATALYPRGETQYYIVMCKMW